MPRRTILTFLATALAGLVVSAMSTTSAMVALFGPQAFPPLFDFLVSAFGLPLIIVAAVAGYVSPRRFWLWGLATICLRPVVIVLSTYPAVRAGVIGPSDYLGLAFVYTVFLSMLAALCTAGSGAGAVLRLLLERVQRRRSGGPEEAAGSTLPPGVEEGFEISRPIRSFARTVRRVLLEPVGFFRSLAPRDNFANPLVFAVGCILIGGLLSGILNLLVGRGVAGGPSVVAEAPAGIVMLAVLAFLIAAPFLTALFVFIAAGVYHLLVMLFVRRSNAGFEATFKASAYASAISLVNWLPVVGSLLSLYGLYLAAVGIREFHSTTTARAAAVVFVPASIVLLILYAVGGVDSLLRFLLRIRQSS